ncbi:MAG: L-histidine N(alpha)-methyltransferase [Dehalococcoidia bacterium]|nr:L-histidine N(alpha)-methyltransferase [Dehalococcoidia bacterium]
MNRIELVTAEDLEDRLGACLEHRELPDYFLYLGKSGYEGWAKLSASSEFPIASSLTRLLRESLSRMVGHFPAVFDLVSIGVGNGEKERLLIEAAHKHSLRYIPVDISSLMLDAALARVNDLEVNKAGLVARFEDLPWLHGFWQSPIVLCLLGNNFCNYEPNYLLPLVENHLGPEDLFLFDCHLIPEHESGKRLDEVENMYRSPLNARFNLQPLVQRGLPEENCAFHLDLEQRLTSAGMAYKTRKCIEILADSSIVCASRRIRFAAGERIRMGFTYKFNVLQVRRFLGSHKFHILELSISEDGSGLLALVRTPAHSQT